LIKTIYMLLYATEHPHPTFLAIYLRTDVKMSSVFPTAGLLCDDKWK